ncbi:hypothetical protein SDC9_124548 [bioreactor metagenome]|uniref:Uncharacterized protein n=1 Tax=bioreactor metagenome TaxID=1076179 RepID=A0A645CLA6_9ZZZZ
MAERGVGFEDVRFLHTLRFEEGAQDLVGGARVHIVGAQQHEAFGAAAFLAHQVFHGRDGLLVGRGTGVEHVLGKLLAFVLNRVEQQAVVLLEHRQHRLARHAGPAAKGDGHLVLREQLLGFFGKQRPVGGRVHHHWLKLLAQHAALGVDVIDRHEHRVLEHGLRDRHCAREAVEHADLDGVLSVHRGRQAHAQSQRGSQC